MTVEPFPKSRDEVEARKRKGADSRGRLLQSARKLFVERGYHDTRPQDIAREAGLGHGTFYLYFPDKRACFLAFVDEARSEVDAMVQARVQALPAHSLAAVIEATLRAVFDYSDAHPGVLLTALSDESVISVGGAVGSTLVERWSEEWVRVLETLGGLGAVRRDCDTTIIGAAIVGLIHHGAVYGSRQGRTPDEIVATLTQFLVHGLAPG